MAQGNIAAKGGEEDISSIARMPPPPDIQGGKWVADCPRVSRWLASQALFGRSVFCLTNSETAQANYLAAAMKRGEDPKNSAALRRELQLIATDRNLDVIFEPLCLIDDPSEDEQEQNKTHENWGKSIGSKEGDVDDDDDIQLVGIRSMISPIMRIQASRRRLLQAYPESSSIPPPFEAFKLEDLDSTIRAQLSSIKVI